MKIYNCKEDKAIKFKGDKILVKQYLDYKMKNLFIQLIIQGLKDADGNFSPSPLSQDLAFTYGILKFYTDLDVENDDLVDLYNNVKGSGLFDEIIGNISSEELLSLQDIIDKSIIIEGDKDNVVSVIKNFLNDISEKLPDAGTMQQTMSKLGEELKQINPTAGFGSKTKLRDLMQKQ